MITITEQPVTTRLVDGVPVVVVQVQTQAGATPTPTTPPARWLVSSDDEAPDQWFNDIALAAAYVQRHHPLTAQADRHS